MADIRMNQTGIDIIQTAGRNNRYQRRGFDFVFQLNFLTCIAKPLSITLQAAGQNSRWQLRRGGFEEETSCGRLVKEKNSCLQQVPDDHMRMII